MRRETAVPRRPKQGALTAAAAAVACLAGGLVGPSVTAAARAAPLPARATAAPAVPARAGDAAGSPLCQRLARYHLASSAAWAFCKGPQSHGPVGPGAHIPAAGPDARDPAAGHRAP